MAGSNHEVDGLKVTIYADLDQPATNANIDVEVVERDGTRWSATFFTVANIEALFSKNAVTGESARGAYFWAKDMILVQVLSVETIEATIRDLRASGAFTAAFSPLDTG